jgi:hypothetical protein
VLREQQRANANLLDDAIRLADQLSAAETAADDAARKLRGLDADADESDRDKAKDAANKAADHADSLRSDLANAKAQILATADAVQEAQQTAANQLDGAMKVDGLTDTVGDNAQQLVMTIARWVDEWMSDWATFFSAAALALSWVPLLGQALLAIDLVLNAVVLLADITLAIAGEKNWEDAIIGVVGLLTYGAGRLAAKGFKAIRAAGSNLDKGLKAVPPAKAMPRPGHKLSPKQQKARGRQRRQHDLRERGRVRRAEMDNASRRRGVRPGRDANGQRHSDLLGRSGSEQLRRSLDALKGFWVDDVIAGGKAIWQIARNTVKTDWVSVALHPVETGRKVLDWTSQALGRHAQELSPPKLPDYLDPDVIARARNWHNARIGIEYGAGGGLTMIELERGRAH